MAMTQTTVDGWAREDPARVGDDEEVVWINGDGGRISIKEAVNGNYMVVKTIGHDRAWCEPGFGTIEKAKRYMRGVAR